MPQIYGSVPHVLPGRFRYANAALVNELVAVGNSSTPSYFDVSKFPHDATIVNVTLEAPAGDYECHVMVSVDDGTARVLRVLTQDSPTSVGIDYINPQHKLSVNVVSAAGPVRVHMRQN